MAVPPEAAQCWRVYRGVYLPAHLADDLLARCRGLLDVLPASARFSHVTAGALLGLPVRASVGQIHVSVPADVVTPRRRPGLITHQRRMYEAPVHVQGVPVSRPAQLFLDLASVLDLAELVVVGDALLAGRLDLPTIQRYLAERPRHRGVLRAREAATLLRQHVDSPQETRLRLAIVRAGLPEPEVNVPVFDAAGGWIGSPDLGYRQYRIAIQYEGDAHRTNRRRWRQDIARDEAFTDSGWLVLRAVADDIVRPQPFLGRLTRRLRERGWLPPPC